MKSAKSIAFGIIMLLIGSAFGYFVGQKNSKYFIYSTSKKVQLLDRNGGTVGELPKGMLITSELPLSRNADLGWWAYVPIYFDSSDIAKRSLESTGFVRDKHFSSISEVEINAK